MGFKTQDLSGKKFNFLTVIRQVEKPLNQKANHTFWLCKCDCGNEKIVDQRALKSGNTKSCGCYFNLCKGKSLSEYQAKRQRKKNEYIKNGNVIEFLTRDGYKFIIDECDFDKVYDKYWVKRGNYIATKNPEGVRPRYTMIHRLILGDIQSGFEVDHINRNPLDNRRCNLRIVTRFENEHNKRTEPKSKDGGFNVYYRKAKNKYEASFTYNNKHYWVGSFNDLNTAQTAVLNKRKEIGGLLYDQRSYGV